MSKINPSDFLLVHREGTDYKALVSELPNEAAPLSEVLAKGNTAGTAQSLRFRLDENSEVPDPSDFNPNLNLLEEGIGAAHRAALSSYNQQDYYGNIYHTNINSMGVYGRCIEKESGDWFNNVTLTVDGFTYWDEDTSVSIDKNGIHHEGKTAELLVGVQSTKPVLKYTGAADFVTATFHDNVKFISGKTESVYTDVNENGLYSLVALSGDSESEVTVSNRAGFGFWTKDDTFYSANKNGIRSKGNTAEFNAQVQNVDPKLTYTGKVEFSNSVTATEFIGDGSKLTNLPSGDVDLSEYARLDGAEFTGVVEFYGYGYTEISGQTVIARGSGTAGSFDSTGVKLADVNTGYNAVFSTDEITAEDATVTAKEFIGDGSKLTGIQAGLPDFRLLPAL